MVQLQSILIRLDGPFRLLFIKEKQILKVHGRQKRVISHSKIQYLRKARLSNSLKIK
jgi:hypothetical protein